MKIDIITKAMTKKMIEEEVNRKLSDIYKQMELIRKNVCKLEEEIKVK
jgi:hypothetical protein